MGKMESSVPCPISWKFPTNPMMMIFSIYFANKQTPANTYLEVIIL